MSYVKAFLRWLLRPVCRWAWGSDPGPAAVPALSVEVYRQRCGIHVVMPLPGGDTAYCCLDAAQAAEMGRGLLLAARDHLEGAPFKPPAQPE